MLNISYCYYTVLYTQNYRWQNRKEYKGKTNPVQSALARLLQVYLRCKDCVSIKLVGLFPPWRTLRPPPFLMLGRAWCKCVVCGCWRSGTTARGCMSGVKGGGGRLAPPWRTLRKIVPNSSSLYSLFYSVIYNSVTIQIYIIIK